MISAQRFKDLVSGVMGGLDLVYPTLTDLRLANANAAIRRTRGKFAAEESALAITCTEELEQGTRSRMGRNANYILYGCNTSSIGNHER